MSLGRATKNFNDHKEKENFIIYVINKLIESKNIPEYSPFHLDDKIKDSFKGNDLEYKKAIEVHYDIDELLRRDNYFEVDQMNLRRVLTPKGRELFKSESWETYQKSKNKATPLFQVNSNNTITSHGDNSPINNQQSVKIEELKQENKNLKYQNDILDKKLKEKTLQLTELQIKEAKNKKFWAFLAAIGSSILTLIISHPQWLQELWQRLFHR